MRLKLDKSLFFHLEHFAFGIQDLIPKIPKNTQDTQDTENTEYRKYRIPKILKNTEYRKYQMIPNTENTEYRKKISKYPVLPISVLQSRALAYLIE